MKIINIPSFKPNLTNNENLTLMHICAKNNLIDVLKLLLN